MSGSKISKAKKKKIPISKIAPVDYRNYYLHITKYEDLVFVVFNHVKPKLSLKLVIKATGNPVNR